MGRVVHFEIHAEDPLRAIGFYETVFGWKIKKWEGPNEYWVVNTGKDEGAAKEWGGINGGLLRRQGQAPAHNNPVSAFVCTIDVDNIDEECKKVVENGGNVVVDKNRIGDMGWMCYCKDTEGNIFGMMQADSKTT